MYKETSIIKATTIGTKKVPTNNIKIVYSLLVIAGIANECYFVRNLFKKA